MLLLQQMTVLFIYILIGYGMAKKGAADEGFSKKVSWLVINVANAAFTISAVVNGEGSVKGEELLLTAMLAVAILGGMVLLSLVAPLFLGVRKEQVGVYRLMFAFNNIGFMGFPVIAAVYGQEALLYAAIFSMLFNVLVYTYGIWAVRGKGEGKMEWGKIVNAGVVGSVIAIAIYLLDIPTPKFFNTTMAGLAGLTAPLSMIVIGISLAGIRLKELFTETKLFLFSLIKLVAVPVLAMQAIGRVVTDNEMLYGVCLVMLSTPAASITAMMAEQYGDEECGELGAKGVALTTLLSVVTIPIVSAIV